MIYENQYTKNSFAPSQRPLLAPTASGSEAQADQMGHYFRYSNLNSISSTLGLSPQEYRIHTGRDAIQRTEALGARAYAYGRDIYFNRGEYQPASPEGRTLLGHELTHVAQQKGHQSVIQKKDDPKKKEDDTPGFNKFVYNIAKEALGEEKLDEYARQLAQVAIDAFLDKAKEQINDGPGSEGDKLASKARALGMATSVQPDLEKAVQDLMKSPGAQQFVKGTLGQIEKNPAAALAALLLGMAAIYLSGGEIDEKFGKFKIGGAVAAKGFTDPAFKKASLSLGAALKKYELGLKTSVEVGKTEPGPKKPEKGMVVGVTQGPIPDQEIEEPQDVVKLKISPYFKLKDRFGISVGPTFDSNEGWGGELALRFGDSKSFIAPSFTLGPSGDLGINLEAKSPFRLKNLSLKAHLLYNYDSNTVKSLGFRSSYTFTPRNPVFDQLFIAVQIDGRHIDVLGPNQLPPPQKVFQAEGVFVIGGRF
ncbi:MAG: DUF4157 domain-containing protein [Bacteroidota bacterium]